MRKFLKKMPVFFLLIAWLVMFAHQIIPHDHHLSQSFTNQDDSCPLSKNTSNHHPVFPAHCHAFNDLASEKAITLVLVDNVLNCNLFFSWVTDVFAFDMQQPLIPCLYFSESSEDNDFLDISLLRAPPLLI
jgi:hypothetical protein